MASLDDMMGDESGDEELSGDVDLEGIEIEETESQGFNFFASSVDKELHEYDNNPIVEVAKQFGDGDEVSKGIKQTVRGLEGITGKETQLALFDVLGGLLRAGKNLDVGGTE